MFGVNKDLSLCYRICGKFDFLHVYAILFPCIVLYIGDVVANAALMDDLARCLDKEYRVLNNWKHMACNLKIPLEIQKGFEIYFELMSPTVHLFPFLSTLNEPGREPLTVGKLKAALKDIHRNDLIENFQSKSCLSLFAIDPIAGSVHQTVMD